MNKEIGLKSLRKANEQEIEEIIKEQWQDDKMQDFVRKNYEYYITTDNYVIEFEKANKRSITKELYYDDEYDAPEVNLYNFMEENRHNGLSLGIRLALKNKDIINVHFCLTYSHSKRNCFIYILTDWEKENKKDFYKIFRDLTEEEKEDYITIMQNIQQQYEERLEKYFKKYKNKITTHGYWANR